jgi:hypothetical protein
MAKARTLDKRRSSIKNIRKITRTMELIANARFKKAMDRATAATAYTNRITQLDTQLNGDPYNHADTSPIIGRYGIGGYMSLQVKPLVKDHVLIEIEGAEPTSARWLCGFSGVGTLMENTVKICHTEQNTPILFTFSEQGVAVTGDNLDYFCGNGGTLVGQYTKLDH